MLTESSLQMVSSLSMIIAYLREQLCLLQRDGPYEYEGGNYALPANDIAGYVPRVRRLYGMPDNILTELCIPV